MKFRHALLLFLIPFVVMSASSQIGMPPIALHASVVGASVRLEWSRPLMMSAGPANQDVLYYKLFRGSTISSMTLRDTTSKLSYVDSPSVSVASTWYYYVTAVTRLGESPRSNIISVSLLGPIHRGTVRIVSVPDNDTSIGQLYQYHVKAVASDSTSIRYSLLLAPSRMTINDSTGLIQWTPTTAGMVNVMVQAVSATGGSDKQTFMIVVSTSHGVVTGFVHDSLGNGVGRTYISLMQSTRNHFAYSAITDSLGKFSFKNVDIGSYFAEAIPTNSSFLPVWYKDAPTQSTATQFSVTDTGTTNLDFTLHPRPVIQTFTVSGTVADTAGSPVRSARVDLISAVRAYNGQMTGCDALGDFSNQMFRDWNSSSQQFGSSTVMTGGPWGEGHSGDGGSPQFIFSAHVDSLGNYSIKVPQGTYVAHAHAPGYIDEYYNNQTNYLLANQIAVSANTTGIDFSLAPAAPAIGEIHGSVVDSSTGNGLPSRVIAYRFIWDSTLPPVPAAHSIIVFTTESDSNGIFVFTNLPAGSYILRAVPMGPYAPVYYNSTGITRDWLKATKIPVNNTVVLDVKIISKPLSRGTLGFTSILGNVRSNGTGVSGVILYALSSSGDIAGVGVSNPGGQFSIDGINPGTYFVNVDAPGYRPPSVPSMNPGYTMMGLSQPSSTTINLTQMVTAVQPMSSSLPEQFPLEQNYPNPFNPSTSIDFAIPKTSFVELKIYNLLGQHVATLMNSTLQTGTYRIVWNGTDAKGMSVPSGVYFYQMKAGEVSLTKKMLLMK